MMSFIEYLMAFIAILSFIAVYAYLVKYCFDSWTRYERRYYIDTSKTKDKKLEEARLKEAQTKKEIARKNKELLEAYQKQEQAYQQQEQARLKNLQLQKEARLKEEQLRLKNLQQEEQAKKALEAARLREQQQEKELEAARQKKIEQRTKLKIAELINNAHFFGNLVETIAYEIRTNKDKDKSADILSEFGNLYKDILHCEAQDITLEQELGFTKRYLALELVRIPNFTYQIHIDSKVNKRLLLPKLLIQSVVNNAIKYGIYPNIRKKNGRLDIYISQDSDFLTIRINDNGGDLISSAARKDKEEIRRKKGEEKGGLEFLNELLENYHTEEKTKERSRISIDPSLSADGSCIGTEVFIKLAHIISKN
jgi:hypothetical protein